MSNSRRGLDALLRYYPEADVEMVDGQSETPDTEGPGPVIRLGRTEGPWVCVDLIVTPLTERERLVLTWKNGPEEWYAEYGGQYGAELVDAERKLKQSRKQFAILKTTGNVYRLDEDGAVEDDPFIHITE